MARTGKCNDCGAPTACGYYSPPDDDAERRWRVPACDASRLGLTDDELTSLTGFATPMVKMLAHARDAWVSADDNNARALVSGLRAMLVGHSFTRNREIVSQVLTHHLEDTQAAAFLHALGLPATGRR